MRYLSIKRRLGLLSGYSSVDSFNLPNDTPQLALKDWREQVEIAVIDDDSFEAGRLLKNYGYKFQEIGDLKSLNEVSKFPIVLCDIMGVGTKFDDKRQGAAIIKEIRNNYPHIIVAAYSGASKQSDQARVARLYSDYFIQKDEDYENWSEKLDEMIKKAFDHRFIWNRIRSSLVSQSVSTRRIIELEDAYIRSLLAKDHEFRELRRAAEKNGTGDFVYSVISGLASNTLFRLMVGG